MPKENIATASRFINRKQELGFLEKKYGSGQAELLVLYGRRRIGKTELLLNFAGSKGHIYFLGRLESAIDTIRRLNQQLIEFFKDTEIARRPLQNWDEIMGYLGKKAEKRLIVILDEFPFIVERFPEIISVMQDKWDNELRKTNLMLILSGSSVSMMEKYTMSHESPLYGRRTGQWMVGKIGVRHLKEFFPKFTFEELVLAYSCLDMIPGYLVKFLPNKSAKNNIADAILSKGEFLYEEPEFLLREELRDPSNYMSILSPIASGPVTFNEIYTRTGLDKGMLSKYLFILEKLELVEKIVPVTETYKGKLKAKGALYSMKDNFFDFWFRFVYSNKQQLEEGMGKQVMANAIEDMNQYMGRKFELFIYNLLPELKIFAFTQIGRWWHKEKEIDLVALNEKTDEALFAECKWQENVDAKKLWGELKEKSGAVNWRNEKRKEKYALFAKSFKKMIKEPNLFLFDARMIEKAMLKRR